MPPRYGDGNEDDVFNKIRLGLATLRLLQENGPGVMWLTPGGGVTWTTLSTVDEDIYLADM